MKRRLLVQVVVAVGVLGTGGVARADGPELVKYVVEKNEHCDDVALRFYGDKKRYELIHQYNPQLGPLPHELKPGMVLTLPKIASVPDARLGSVRNEVQVEAPSPRPGKANDPLFRGNRVGTQQSSSAEVNFRDTTTLLLGERSLVVILGASRSLVGRAEDASLVSGHLRAFIAARETEPLRVASGSSRVSLGRGAAKVSVDDKKTTRLAVYEGGSQLASAGKTIQVDHGYGSKAEDKLPPTPPKPLPLAPTWENGLAPLLLVVGQTADAVATYRATAGPGAPTATTFHVQLAKDRDFRELLVDVTVPSTIVALEAHALEPGTYFARVSAFDDDLFEGPYGAVTETRVAATTLKAGRNHAATLSLPEGLFCGVDGAALAPVGSVELRRTRGHRLSCSNDPSGKDSATLVVPADTLAPRVTNAALVGAAPDKIDAKLVFELRDREGVLVPDAEVVANPKEGFAYGPARPLGDGRYELPVTRLGPAAFVAVRLTVNDLEAADVSALALPVAPPAPPAKAGAGGTLTLALDGGTLSRSFGTVAYGASAGFGFELPVSGAIDFRAGLRGSYFAALGGDDDRDALLAGAPIGLRFGRARLRKTIGLVPVLARERFEGAGHAVLFGGEARVGLEYALGSSGGFFGELGYRLTTARSRANGDVASLAGATLSLGYRFDLR